MELYKKLRKEHLNSRLERNMLKSNLLGSVLGEMETQVFINKTLAKDDLVIKTIQKFSKNLRIVDTDDSRKELEILEKYLPKELSEAEVLIELEKLNLGNLPHFGAKMGRAMGVLKGKVNGSVISKIIKEHYS